MSATSTYLPVREAWLAQRQEAPLEPGLPIVDPHHHLWDRPGWRYLLPELLEDLNTGHRITATVFIQCRAMLRAHGPEAMRPVGETEFVNGIAAMSDSGGYGPTRVCAGIRPCRSAPRRPGDAGAGGPHRGRGRPVPRHPPHQHLGRRRLPAHPRLPLHPRAARR